MTNEEVNLQPEGSSAKGNQDQSIRTQRQSADSQTMPQHSTASSATAQPVPPAAGVKKMGPMIATTKLDLDACRKVVSKLVSNKASEPASLTRDPDDLIHVPPDQPITRYKKASPCNVDWAQMSGTDRYRLCPQCQSFVYDFKGMELEEAESLVYKREEKKCSVFYRRSDGKFLAHDCRIGAARAKKRIISVAAVCLFMIGVIAVWMFAPHPAPVTTAVQRQASPAMNKKPAQTSGVASPIQLPKQVNGAPLASSPLLLFYIKPNPPAASKHDAHQTTAEPKGSPSSRLNQVPGSSRNQLPSSSVSNYPTLTPAQESQSTREQPHLLGARQDSTVMQTDRAAHSSTGSLTQQSQHIQDTQALQQPKQQPPQSPANMAYPTPHEIASPLPSAPRSDTAPSSKPPVVQYYGPSK